MPRPSLHAGSLRRLNRFARLFGPQSKGSTLPILVLALACLCASALQAQRRDFAATYQISHAVPSGDQVALTIILKIMNYSGADIHSAGVVLYNASKEVPGMRENDPIGAFDLIDLFPSYKQITLTHRFTVPAAEYARWQQGREPELVFLKPGHGSEGETTASKVHIDLRRKFAPGETFPGSNAQGNEGVAR